MTTTYPSGMFARLVTMLAVLALAVMTTATSAHAARLDAGPDHSLHVSGMMQVAAAGETSCDGERFYETGAVESCELLCSSLSIFLTPPGECPGNDCASARHDLPPSTIAFGQVPGMAERPPKLRLL